MSLMVNIMQSWAPVCEFVLENSMKSTAKLPMMFFCLNQVTHSLFVHLGWQGSLFPGKVATYVNSRNLDHPVYSKHILEKQQKHLTHAYSDSCQWSWLVWVDWQCSSCSCESAPVSVTWNEKAVILRTRDFSVWCSDWWRKWCQV